MAGTSLRDVKNFGPVTLSEMESMGLTTVEQIFELGFEEVCRRWIQYYPERLNANAFLAVACLLEDTVWTKATPDQRRAAHGLVQQLRSEFGLPPSKPPTRRRARRA